nr:hypothetical protein [Pedobacter sp. ASV19]
MSLDFSDSFEEKKIMETLNNNKTNRHFGLGIFMLVIGVIYMIRNVGISIPFWVLSWHTILLAIGLLIGYKKNFRSGAWVVLVIIGGIYTLQSIIMVSLTSYSTAFVFIGLGLYLVLKPKKEVRFCGVEEGKEKINFQDVHEDGK